MKRAIVLFLFLMMIPSLFGQRNTIQPNATGMVAIQQSGAWYYGAFTLRNTPTTGMFNLEALRVQISPLYSSKTGSFGFAESEYIESTQQISGSLSIAVIRTKTTTIYLYAMTGNFSCVQAWTNPEAEYMLWLWGIQWADGRQETNIRIQRLQEHR